MMREATRRSVRAHRAAERAFRAGASEFGIHLVYCQAAGQDMAELPYNNIIALNEHSAVLHYTERDVVPPRQVRSFLIDAGASHHGYACDITRTYALDAGQEFQAMIDAVDAAQLRMCDQVRAGVDYKQIHVDAHLALAGILWNFGVIKVSPRPRSRPGVSSAFFPHGIGHGIGLQVHEVAGFAASDEGGTIAKPDGHPYLRLTRGLEPGMVVTIEPGHLLHRHAARRGEEERPRRQHQLGARGRVQAIRRHPHRGRCGLHRSRAAQPDPRRFRRSRVIAWPRMSTWHARLTGPG
jgi:Xaa-Pro dipeptidase